jgi:hypothetical protein
MNAKARRLPTLAHMHAHAAAILALPRHVLTEPLYAKDRDEWHAAHVLLAPVAVAYAPGAVPMLGRFYSPLEEMVVRLLAGTGQPLQGKQIALGLGRPCDRDLRGELGTLEARGVIVHQNGEGYALAQPSLPASGSSPSTTWSMPAGTRSLPGRHFSPIEQRVFDSLAGGPLTAKEIAAAIGENNTGPFRQYIANLVARGAIIRDPEGEGYRQAPPTTA